MELPVDKQDSPRFWLKIACSLQSSPDTFCPFDSAPPSVTADTAFTLSVRALDAQNNSAVRYSGTVLISSSDGAFAPFLYTFQPTDFGVHAFTLTPTLAGALTVTAQDQVTSTILGTIPVLVV